MRKGVSEVVSLVILVVMVVAASGSFFYWFSSGQEDAQAQTEMHQTNVFDQIHSQTSALIDVAYSSNREVNINNFAEYITQICAKEKKINMAAEEIRVEVYEGYGAATELVCAVKDFSGGCNANETTIFGVLGGKSTVNGLYTVSSTDGTTWTTSSVGSDYNSYKAFNFTHLDGFIEGNNNTRNPENMLLMGVGKHSTSGTRKSVLAVLDRTLKGNSYNISDLDENITAYYDAELAQEVPGSPFSLYRGGALVDPDTEKPKEAILTKQFAAYDSPERLAMFGFTRPIVGAKITALQEILRMNLPQLLVGVTGDASEGGISYIDETVDIVTGQEADYTNPVTECPYDVTSFAACGVTVDPVACSITLDGIPQILKVPEFTNNTKVTSDPVFIAVNNLTNGTGKVPAVFWTGYIQDSSNIYCINLEDAGADPSYDITEMKYHQNSNQVLLFLKAAIGAPGFQVLAIRDDGGTYTASTVSPPVGTGVNPETFDAVGDYLYVGGSDGTNATIIRFRVNSSNGAIANETTVYTDNTYSEVQKLFSYTACTERQPDCVTGCNQILKKGDCTILNVSIEDSSCDISKYSSGTQFTVKTAIGKYFEKLEIFEKVTGTSAEVNATEVG